jgi:hypothetical protein
MVALVGFASNGNDSGNEAGVLQSKRRLPVGFDTFRWAGQPARHPMRGELL